MKRGRAGFVRATLFDADVHRQAGGIVGADAHPPSKAHETLQVELTASLHRGSKCEVPLCCVVWQKFDGSLVSGDVMAAWRAAPGDLGPRTAQRSPVGWGENFERTGFRDSRPIGRGRAGREDWASRTSARLNLATLIIHPVSNEAG